MLKKLVIFIAVFPLASLSSAEQLTLKEAIQKGLKDNRGIKASERLREADKLGVNLAKSMYYPNISLSEQFSASSIPSRAFMMKLDQGAIAASDFTPSSMNDPKTKTDFTTSLILKQPLYDSSISSRLETAKGYDQLSERSYTRNREETALKIFRSYYSVIKAKNHLASAEMSVESAKEQERLARVRVEQGVGLKSDQLRARTHLSEMEQQRISSGNSLEIARMELARIIGEQDGARIEVDSDLLQLNIPKDRKDLLETAFQNRMDLAAGKSMLEISQAAVSASNGEYLPKLYASAGYQINGNSFPLEKDNDGWFIGASLNWEIFDGMRKNAALSQSLESRSAAEYAFEEHKSMVALEVAQKQLRRDEAGKRLEAVRHAMLDAEETSRLVKTRYQNSLALFIELLDAEVNLNRSRTALADYETEYLIAGGELLHATGMFLKEVLK